MDTTAPKKRLTKVASLIDVSPYHLDKDTVKAILAAWADESIPYAYNQDKLKAELEEIVSLLVDDASTPMRLYRDGKRLCPR